ncbi:methyltransferase domain-containing protein [Actinoallomurus sp. NBC_01490]|uniref:methyltransferase domain-containing protein n=1 Tax=Actinoallomurus sp. NBC_01490 TaxID=2903557 RepID=UPI002E3120B2|nr:methyltransferase domain-containing protein [Actinoallomurus sp. NBC_01490]
MMPSQGLTSDVAALYDGVAQVVAATWGPDLHFGYWDDDNDASTVEEATNRLTDMVMEGVAPRPGQHILDIGCGIGNPAMRLLNAHKVSVHGITVSQVQVAEATARAGREGMSDRATFQYADAADMPFVDASFDAAWAIESMAHMDDCERMLSETARVLRPGGRLAIVDVIRRDPVAPERQGDVDAICRLFALHTLETVDRYEQWLKAQGFVDVRVRDIGDHVMPRTGMAMARAVEAKRDELVDLVGAEQADALIAFMRTASRTHEIGYIYATAIRG